MSNDKSMSLSSLRKAYVLLGFLIMICLGTVYSWSVFRLPIQEIYNIGSTESGLPYMTSLAFYALFMFLTGKILDRYSPRTVISAGAALIALGWICAALAPNIFVFTFFYGVVSGTGVGVAYGVPLAIIAKWFPENKGLAVGLVLVGFGLSPLVTAPVARQLIVSIGAMNTFMVLGVSFGILLPLLSLPLTYPKEEAAGNALDSPYPKSNEGIDTEEMIRTGAFKTLYVNFFIGTTIGLMMIGMTSSVGIGFSELPPETVYSLLPLFAIFNGIGRPLFGWLTDRASVAKAMNFSYVLIMLAALVMLFPSGGGPLPFAVSFSIFWLNLGGWLAIAPGATISLFGSKHYSRNYGLVFTAYGIGAITGVLASGALVDILNDYRMIFILVIGLCMSGILFSRKLKA